MSLSGDGGDELFAGYDRYFTADATWRKLRRIPQPLRQAISGCATVLQDYGVGLGRSPFGHNGLAQASAITSADEVYRYVASQWKMPANIAIDGYEQPNSFHQTSKLPEFFQRMMLHDTLTYLPDDILTKVDRASMAVGLEARVPLLDHRVVEFAWRIPYDMKVRGTQRKWLLRQVLYQYVPQQLIDRPKMGFGVPLEHWLRGPLP